MFANIDYCQTRIKVFFPCDLTLASVCINSCMEKITLSVYDSDTLSEKLGFRVGYVGDPTQRKRDALLDILNSNIPFLKDLTRERDGAMIRSYRIDEWGMFLVAEIIPRYCNDSLESDPVIFLWITPIRTIADCVALTNTVLAGIA